MTVINAELIDVNDTNIPLGVNPEYYIEDLDSLSEVFGRLTLVKGDYAAEKNRYFVVREAADGEPILEGLYAKAALPCPPWCYKKTEPDKINFRDYTPEDPGPYTGPASEI